MASAFVKVRSMLASVLPSGRTDTSENDREGETATVRVNARGRVYVVINYPLEVEQMEDVQFNQESCDALLKDLHEYMPDFDFNLECGPIPHYCKHAIFYNSSDPQKTLFKLRVRVEILYTGGWHGIDPKMVKHFIMKNMDPEGKTFIDTRCELGRFHTSSHLETVLRI